MRILVTGATGFVGKHLVCRLSDEGHEVFGLTRNPANPRLDQRAKWIAYQPPLKSPPAEFSSGFDAVINLAGEPIAEKRWNSELKKRIYDSRVVGTRALMDALRASGKSPQVLISASAVDYYGDRANEPLSESAPPGKGFLSEVCQDWEREAVVGLPGTRTAVLRIGLVIGKGGGALSRMLIPFRAGIGGRLGTGEQWVSWIHLQDLVGLILFALKDSRAQGPINAVSPEAVTNKVLTAELGKAVGMPAIMPVPLWALRLTVGEVAEILTSSHRVHPGKATEMGFRFQYPNIAGAFSEALAVTPQGMKTASC